MGGMARRGAGLFALACVALVLLLLARLPPARVPGGHREPSALVHAPSTPNDKAPSSSSNPVPANVTSLPTVPSPQEQEKPSPRNISPPADKPASSDKPVNKPAEKKQLDPLQKVVYTKELYEAGHMWPHPELCPSLGSSVQVLILVTSAPSHRPARDAVRLTWGHYAARKDVAMAFVLGSPPKDQIAKLKSEDALYGDIIIGNSIDSYSNLTLKTLSMLEWADTYCPRARFLLKTDDDMFINIPKLLAFVQASNRINATKTIWGKVLKKSLPKRIPKSKYYLSRIQYAPKVLPNFATGPAYVLTRDCVHPLLQSAWSRPYVRLEDVFVTGILAAAAGIRLTHAHEFYNKKISPHPCAVQRGISIHMVQYHEQFDLWRKLLDGTAKCS